MIIYLALGSNLGKREEFLQRAVDELAKVVVIKQVSPVYETPPWGEEDQPAFLNAALSGETELAPETLFDEIKRIEQKLGRHETYRWGPREIDIDILFYGDQVINSQRLTIPHPRLHERAFVLVPLVDIAADFIHPVLGEPIQELLGAQDKNGIKPISLKLSPN